MNDMVERGARAPVAGNAAAIAATLCQTERDMLLDFCGLESGKVCAGAAMWEIARDFDRRGLMAGWPSQCAPTDLGREVAVALRAAIQSGEDK